MRIERYLVAVEALEECNAKPPTAREVSISVHGSDKRHKIKVTQQALHRAEGRGLLISGARLHTNESKTYSISAAGEERLEEPEWE